ncbi:MAG TPA: hypothetical protein VJK49_07255 [Candidatus Limnocylindrales bacterium]|nr:hypothetical protein [Candidatus Limnocylindrales bacterium]
MDEGRLDKLEQRLDELDQRGKAMERAMDKAMDRSRQAMDMILPSETRRHLRAAGREQLLAVRSLLDYWVNKMADSTDSEASANHSSRENIPID